MGKKENRGDGTGGYRIVEIEDLLYKRNMEVQRGLLQEKLWTVPS